MSSALSLLCLPLAAGYLDSKNGAGGEVSCFFQALLRHDEAGARYEKISLKSGVF